MLMGGGWSQEELHPPPKGLSEKKLERERKRERQNNVDRKTCIIIHVPYGGVI